MNVFLRLKHWQLVGLLCIAHIISMIAAILDEQPTIMFIAGLLFFGIFFGWYYTLGINLNKKLPNKVKMNLTKFKWILFILTAYMILFNMFFFSFWLKKVDYPGSFVVLLPFQLPVMFLMLYCLYFTAKSLKVVELQRPVDFKDYAEEFFLFCFLPIGIWIIQPKINKIFESKS